jgi:hypothetical protein
MTTTIDNLTMKNKHGLSAAAAYAQLSAKAEKKGQTIKQLAASMRNEATAYDKEFVRLDAALARGTIPLAERPAAMARYDVCKAESWRLTFVCSLYAQQYERLRTQKAAAALDAKNFAKLTAVKKGGGNKAAENACNKRSEKPCDKRGEKHGEKILTGDQEEEDEWETNVDNLVIQA